MKFEHKLDSLFDRVIEKHPNHADKQRPARGNIARTIAGAIGQYWMINGIREWMKRGQALSEQFDALLQNDTATNDEFDTFTQDETAHGRSRDETIQRLLEIREKALHFIAEIDRKIDDIDQQTDETMQTDTPIPPSSIMRFGMQEIHRMWESLPRERRKRPNGEFLKHPNGALLEAWLTEQPDRIQADGRKDALFPEGLISNPLATASAQLRLYTQDELPSFRHVEQRTTIPFFSGPHDSEHLLFTLLILADAAGFNALRPGRGVRIDKRLLIFTLLAMSRNQRRADRRYEWRPTLRELRDLIWPLHPNKHGRMVSSFRPGTHGPALLQGLQAVNIATIPLPNGDHWQPVHVWQYPTRDLDRETIIEIRLPDGCDHGAAIDRQALIAAGAISDPAFNIEIGLAYIWDEAKARNGGHRIRATQPEVLRDPQRNIINGRGEQVPERSGKLSKNWNHPDAIPTGRHVRHPHANKVRVLTREDRRRLAYGPETRGKSRNQITNERNNAERLLIRQETAGRITIERDAIDARTGKSGWRILQNWTHHD